MSREGAASTQQWLLVIAFVGYYVAALSKYRLFYILVAVAALAGLGRIFSRGRIEKDALVQLGLMYAFFVYLACTSLWAVSPEHALAGAARDVIFPVLWLAAYVAGLESRGGILSTLFRAQPYAAALVFLYLLLRYGMVRPIDEETARAFGAIANYGALSVAVGLPFLVRDWGLHRSMRAAFELALAGVTVLVSRSRAGYVLAVLGLMASCGVFGRGVARRGTFCVGILAVGLVVVALAQAIPDVRMATSEVVERVWAHVEVTLVEGEEVGTGGVVDLERRVMLKEGWAAFVASPLLGIGYQNLPVWVDRRWGFEVASHNLLVTLFAEGGLPAALLFGWFLARQFRSISVGLRGAQEPEASLLRAARASLGVAVAAGLVHPVIQFPGLWVVLGAAAGAAAGAARAAAGGSGEVALGAVGGARG